MPNLPSVFVELRASSQQFNAAMQSAQGELKKTADVAQSNSDRMAQVGKVAFAGLSAAAIGFGAVAVKAFMDSQKVVAQTEAVLTSTGSAAGVTADQVGDLASSLQNMSGVSDETIQAGENMLLTFTNIRNAVGEGNDIFNQATKILLDMSVALGTDMSTQAIQLGKALNDPVEGVTALTRVGVTFTEQQKEQIKALAESGKTMEAQKIILAELNKEFGGSAEAAGKTFAGQLNILKNRADDFMEAVGGRLVPVLSSMVGVAATAAGWFARHQEILGVLAGIIGGPLVAAMTVYIARQAMAFSESVIGTIGGITKAVFGLTAAEEAAAAGATSMGMATALATGGLSILGALAGGVAMHFLGQSDAQDEAGTSAVGLGGALTGLSGAEGALGDDTDATTGSLKAQQDLFKQLNGDVNAMQGEVLKLIGDQQGLDRATRTLNETSKQDADNKREQQKAADNLTKAQDKLTKATETYNKLQAGLGNEISMDQVHAHHDLEQAQLNHETAQKDVAEAVAKYGKDSVEARQASLDLESATFTLTDAQEAMGNVGKEAWEKVDQAQKAVTEAKDGVQKAIEDQTKAQESLKKQTEGNAANTLAWQQAQNTLNTDWEKFSGMLASHPEMRDQLVSQLKAMKDNLPKGADTKPLQDLIDKINGLDLEKIKQASLFGLVVMNDQKMTFKPGTAEELLNMLGKGPAAPAGGPTLDQILTGGAGIFGGGAAEGAVVKARPGGTLMLVGEGGKDEVIAPLDRAGLALGGVTININGYNGDSAELARTVRDELLRMGRNNGGNGLG